MVCTWLGLRARCREIFYLRCDFAAKCGGPVIPERLGASRSKAIRRAKFKGYSRTDKSLDDICRRICQLEAPQSELEHRTRCRDQRNTRTVHGKNVLAALGNASLTSTGFGHGPAPAGSTENIASKPCTGAE